MDYRLGPRFSSKRLKKELSWREEQRIIEHPLIKVKEKDLDKLLEETRKSDGLAYGKHTQNANRNMPVKRGAEAIEYFQGQHNPLMVFPEEIWLLILQQTSCMDRLFVCRASSALDEAFGRHKSNWLLPSVLPHLMPLISCKTSLLKMRQVCKDWRTSVDTFLESEHPSRRPFTPNHPLEQLYLQQPSPYSSLLRSGLEYHTFKPGSLKKITSFPQPGALVGRSLFLQISSAWPDPSVDQFLQAMLNFTEQHGSHVWHLKVINYSSFSFPRFYQQLVQCLCNLPNLRTLDVRRRLYFDPDHNRGPVRDEPVPLTTNGLPSLPHLIALNTIGFSTAIENYWIRKLGPQLERLSVDAGHFEPTGPINIRKVSDLSLAGIIDCQLEYMSPLERDAPTNTTRLEPLPQVRKLCLDMSNCTRLNGHELLTVLSRTYPGLEQLRIILHMRCAYELEERNQALTQQLVNLKVFELEANSMDIFNFTPLLHGFPNLEYLHFIGTFGKWANRKLRTFVRSVDLSVEIERFLYGNRLEQSLVWDSLPKLKLLTYETDGGKVKKRCGREEARQFWERKQKEFESRD